jgi:hypothetical protein
VSNAWKEVCDEAYIVIREIKQFIKDYDYSDPEKSKKTDSAICSFFLEQLSQAENIIHDIIDLAFELQKENELTEILEKIRDEIDIFSDEIQARFCEWKNVPKEYLKKIVLRDSYLIIGVQQLTKNLEMLRSEYLKLQKEKSAFEYEKELKKLLLQTKEIEKQIDNLAVLFKEREGLCNIKPISLKRTFDKIREDAKDNV